MVTLLLLGCASPREELWPPQPGSLTHPVYVSLDTWHAMIAFPVPAQHSELSPQHLYEEWGYAERAWYLGGRTGVTGIMRALFWPTEGIVVVGRHDKLWVDRTPQPPSTLFTFDLSEEGHRRLREHLRATIAQAEPITTMDSSTFYPADRSYHLFHTCHQYAAHALRKAGLPISPFWAFSRSSLAMQLQRAVRLAQERGLAPPASALPLPITGLMVGGGPVPK
jgi:hypothetical protein